MAMTLTVVRNMKWNKDISGSLEYHSNSIEKASISIIASLCREYEDSWHAYMPMRESRSMKLEILPSEWYMRGYILQKRHEYPLLLAVMT